MSWRLFFRSDDPTGRSRWNHRFSPGLDHVSCVDSDELVPGGAGDDRKHLCLGGSSSDLMTPQDDHDGTIAFRQVWIMSAALIVMSLFPAALGMTGSIYVLAALLPI